MSRYQATIVVDRNTWIEFRAMCYKLDTTASAELEKFMRQKLAELAISKHNQQTLTK